MKKLYFLLLLLFSGLAAFANHITGGEMSYTLTRQSGNNFTYHVVLKLYRDCYSPAGSADLGPEASISIFDNANNSSVYASMVPRRIIDTLSLGSPSSCINNPPAVCYQVGYYEFDVTLPGTAQGYTITYQRCCRIAGINNLLVSNSVGATYTAKIPGTSALPSAPANNSARFIGADTVIVCANSYFCYDFKALDLDGDSLTYSFCNAFTGGTPSNSSPNPPAAPPYISVPYASPYTEMAPLGSGVTLDPKTGMMCGIAPPAGIYVVTVCVTEYRNGVAIATQRKDLQIKIGNCNRADAALRPEYISCDGFTYTFSNEAPPSPLIKSYFWDFGDGSTSTEATPSHTYADTGTYTFKLIINRNEECSDNATAIIKVYPGFFPGFRVAGICINKPTSFFDTTKTRYGAVSSWSWDFGDLSSVTDVSTLQNPKYTYTQTGIKNVRFIVASNKGCIDTVYRDVAILDKPPLSVAFKDTLICNGDRLQLQAVGNGNFSWTPLSAIINENTANPTVNPSTTTKYFVLLDDNGCTNRDTVQVRVVNFVSLQARGDTTICAGDSVSLTATGNGLQYSWTPATTISNPAMANTMARPNATTTYQVTAFIGGCVPATDNVLVTLVPYPVANAGPDTAVCFNTPAQINASIVGNSFTWSPVASLNDPNSLSPIAKPKSTTGYILTVRDIIGCPKPGRDTVIVTVLPKVNAFAGNDTAVVVGQPLQFNARGGEGYLWTPGTALNQVTIFNPVGLYDGSFDSIQYKVLVTDAIGCMDSAFVTVRIFKTNPQIFVPSAFTPNRDGKNDVFRPIAVGITRIEYFRVFNRWGELVFSTTTNESGWDGRIQGINQATGTYVWLVKAVDYTGKSFFAKGTVTLIR